MPEMFGPEHTCPHCASKVRRYIGPPFPGVRRVVNVPTGSYHVCIPARECHPEHLGQQRECIACWRPIHVAADGRRSDLDGAAHDCGDWLLE